MGSSVLPFAPSCDLDQLERSKCGTRPSASHLANGFDRPSAHVRIAAKPAMCIAGPAMPTEACLSVWIVHPRAPATRQVAYLLLDIKGYPVARPPRV